jgi:zinc transporter ZupT
MEPILVVLICATAAALVAALGVLPLIGREEVPGRWLGWSNAAAAGMMLAATFVLADAGVSDATLSFGFGALLGIAFIHGSRAFSGTEELALNQLHEASLAYGYEVLLVSSLHSAAEGIAIGALMAVDLSAGIFVTVALALHNMPEATLLAAVFRSRGVSMRRTAALAVISNASQVLMAVSTFAILEAAPVALPWALGIAAGAVLYLVMIDLLPESYRQAGPTSIALVTILAMGAFALIRGAGTP